MKTIRINIGVNGFGFKHIEFELKKDLSNYDEAICKAYKYFATHSKFVFNKKLTANDFASEMYIDIDSFINDTTSDAELEKMASTLKRSGVDVILSL